MKKKIRPVRLLIIIKLLEQRENTTLVKMCRVLKCSRRTFYRDIGLLKKLGVPITLREKTYRLNRSGWARLSAKDLMRKG